MSRLSAATGATAPTHRRRSPGIGGYAHYRGRREGRRSRLLGEDRGPYENPPAFAQVSTRTGATAIARRYRVIDLIDDGRWPPSGVQFRRCLSLPCEAVRAYQVQGPPHLSGAPKCCNEAKAFCFRKLWPAAAGVGLAALSVAGCHVTDAPVDQIIDIVLFGLIGLFRLMATRSVHIAAPQ
jgi:hypothetical protein